VRTQSEATADVFLHVAAQALKYAFDHRKDPLSPLVVKSFGPVYHALLQASALQESLSAVLGLFDWDKGKQLREELVDAFYNSNWPAGDLLLAVSEPSLIRKLYKRVTRKWYGRSYVEKMAEDLGRRSGPEAAQRRDILISLINDPNFYEDWD
jgi:hypothetical protein